MEDRITTLHPQGTRISRAKYNTIHDAILHMLAARLTAT